MRIRRNARVDHQTHRLIWVAYDSTEQDTPSGVEKYGVTICWVKLVAVEEVKEWKLFDADRGVDSAREVREYFIPDFKNWD